MEVYVGQFIALVDGGKLSVLLAMVFANLITGVAVSIYTKTFRLKEIGGFLTTKVLPYVLVYFAMGIVVLVEKTWEVALVAVWVIIVASLAGAIIQNLREMGIKIPEILGGK